jgi:hypothetical protein
MHLHLLAGWAGVLLGIATGAILGLGFHDGAWLGGYGSWPRRLIRLGHIAWFGTAALNLAYAWSLPAATHPLAMGIASPLWLIGAATMSPCCFLAARSQAYRHFFALPVAALAGAAVLTLTGVWP